MTISKDRADLIRAVLDGAKIEVRSTRECDRGTSAARWQSISSSDEQAISYLSSSYTRHAEFRIKQEPVVLWGYVEKGQLYGASGNSQAAAMAGARARPGRRLVRLELDPDNLGLIKTEVMELIPALKVMKS